MIFRSTSFSFCDLGFCNAGLWGNGEPQITKLWFKVEFHAKKKKKLGRFGPRKKIHMMKMCINVCARFSHIVLQSSSIKSEVYVRLAHSQCTFFFWKWKKIPAYVREMTKGLVSLGMHLYMEGPMSFWSIDSLFLESENTSNVEIHNWHYTQEVTRLQLELSQEQRQKRVSLETQWNHPKKP